MAAGQRARVVRDRMAEVGADKEGVGEDKKVKVNPCRKVKVNPGRKVKIAAVEAVAGSKAKVGVVGAVRDVVGNRVKGVARATGVVRTRKKQRAKLPTAIGSSGGRRSSTPHAPSLQASPQTSAIL